MNQCLSEAWAMQNTGGRALKAKPSKLKFPSLPHTSQLPVWGSGNHPRLAVTSESSGCFPASQLSVPQLINAVPLELLLEYSGFHGISLVLSVAEMDALCCSGVEERPSCWSLGELGLVGALSSPLCGLVIPEVTEPSVSCARAVNGGFCSVLSQCCLCYCLLFSCLHSWM